MAMSHLRTAAAAVLRANDRGSHTVPSPNLYPHQWAWDSAFASVGWAHLDPVRAVVELRTLLDGAWNDGRVPHLQFHSPGDYFPGPALWGPARSSTITQPPMWASAARRIAAVAGESELVADLLPIIEASHEFFGVARDPLGWGLVAIAHPWESGMDNAPQWDRPLQQVEPALSSSLARVDIDLVDEPGQRPSDDQYLRYLSLVAQIAACGYGPGPFAVYDPFFTAILARAETDLAEVARASGDLDRAARAERRGAGMLDGLIERLWDEDAGRFGYHDVSADRRDTPDVIGAYGPLVLGDALPENVARALREGLMQRYATPWPLPTTAPSETAFDAHGYWRGPSWININWLMAPFAGLDLVERSLELLQREGFREYFDCRTGEGLGARSFSWSAALALDWLADR